MIGTLLGKPPGAPLRVLLLGAHCDDIEIGCGGTVLELLEERPGVEALWVVLGSTPVRKREALRAANLFLAGVETKEVIVRDFRDGFMPFAGDEVKGFFEELKARFSPDVIFTHCGRDLHQDHRLVSQLTWNTWRDHLVLEYEVPKYDGDLGSPNVFVRLDEETCRRKTSYILEAFESQAARHWFSEETFRALARIRGVECAAPGKYAEGFYCRKLLLEA